MNAAPAVVVTARPEWVLLGAEAKARGFKNNLAFRRWCQSRGVHVRKDGAKVMWIAPADVDRAIAALFAVTPTPANDVHAEAEAAVTAFTGRRGR